MFFDSGASANGCISLYKQWKGCQESYNLAYNKWLNDRIQFQTEVSKLQKKYNSTIKSCNIELMKLERKVLVLQEQLSAERALLNRCKKAAHSKSNINHAATFAPISAPAAYGEPSGREPMRVSRHEYFDDPIFNRKYMINEQRHLYQDKFASYNEALARASSSKDMLTTRAYPSFLRKRTMNVPPYLRYFGLTKH